MFTSEFYHPLIKKNATLNRLLKVFFRFSIYILCFLSHAAIAVDDVNVGSVYKNINTPKVEALDPNKLIFARENLVSYYEQIAASVYLITVNNQNLIDSPNGSGSAVAISRTQLLTNCHIFGKKIELEGNIIKVIKRGSPVLSASLVYKNPESDRCILEVDGGNIYPVKAVRSLNSLKVGERVYAIGNPKGFIDAFAEGLISAIKPSKKTGVTILTTTGIAKGSSGGALFDISGNLIGITTAVISDAPHLALVIPAESFFSEKLSLGH